MTSASRSAQTDRRLLVGQSHRARRHNRRRCHDADACVGRQHPERRYGRDVYPLDVPLAQLRERSSMKWTQYDADVLPLPVAELDVALAAPIASVLGRALDRSDTGYAGDTGGLLAAFAGFASRRWGWVVEPADVRTCGDVAVGVTEVLRALVDPGDPVLIMPPVYPPFWNWLADVQARPVEVPLLDVAAGGRLDLDGIERSLVAGCRVVLLCSPHNPTGRVHEPAELAALASSAAQHGATVVSDEIHAPLVLPGSTFTPYLTVSPEAVATGIAVHSGSKAWNLAGLKCALVVAGGYRSRELLERLPAGMPYGAGHLGVLAAEAAFSEGEPWLDQLLAAVASNVQLLGPLLADALPEVRWSTPQASYLAWLDCRALGLGDDPAAVLLERGRVALGNGPAFGAPGAGFARLNLGCSPEVVTEAVARMARGCATST